jgi:hypothetical protein
LITSPALTPAPPRRSSTSSSRVALLLATPSCVGTRCTHFCLRGFEITASAVEDQRFETA